jgi:hypothetical protein
MGIENENMVAVENITNKKNETIERLKDAFSSGSLELDEFESRVYRGENAKSNSELDLLISDLTINDQIGKHHSISESEKVSCNMANKKLNGTILKTKKLIIDASMSTIRIDYNEIVPVRGTQEITVILNMTNLMIILPDDVVVENRVQENMSTYNENRNKNYDPIGAKTTIILTGTSKMSTIKVKRKRNWFLKKGKR